MSKMGISTIASYRCSKLFEAVGLHDDVVGLCFQGRSAALVGRALRLPAGSAEPVETCLAGA
ncbi:glutamate synthase central domain-containing protein [Escherichia coli]